MGRKLLTLTQVLIFRPVQHTISQSMNLLLLWQYSNVHSLLFHRFQHWINPWATLTQFVSSICYLLESLQYGRFYTNIWNKTIFFFISATSLTHSICILHCIIKLPVKLISFPPYEIYVPCTLEVSGIKVHFCRRLVYFSKYWIQ